ncbi:hypothetical protein Leryth_025626 [Lithospermum erythrorhizon]|nr:hypothetical protein Leryth_025626 [Lithospermum erythrorhizon]
MSGYTPEEYILRCQPDQLSHGYHKVGVSVKGQNQQDFNKSATVRSLHSAVWKSTSLDGPHASDILGARENSSSMSSIG